MSQAEKPEGWFWSMTAIGPARLCGGERNAVIGVGMVAGLFGMEIAPKVTGSFGPVPMGWAVAGGALAFWLVGVAVLNKCWSTDPCLFGPTMDGTLFRYLRRWNRRFLPSHSSWAASDFMRQGQRKLEHFKR